MSDIKRMVQDQFGGAAASYRSSPVHVSGEDLARIAAEVGRLAAPTVLDVGCGAGHVSRVVAPLSDRVVALDLTPAMLEQVAGLMEEHGITNVATRQGDAEQLPFADGSFDMVVSRYSAHHWPHPERAIGECLRVLRPGGRLLISDIVAPEEPAHDTFLQTIELLRDPSHVRDYRVSEWLATLGRAGAAAEVLATWAAPMEFVSWVGRMATPPDRVAVLRELLAASPPERREAFAIQPDGSFSLRGALIAAVRG